MHEHNVTITKTLAIASLLYWTLIAIFPTRLIISYPDVQVPFGLGLLTLTGLGWIMIRWSDRTETGVTRCRVCRHILQGLSQPRCPECGEHI